MKLVYVGDPMCSWCWGFSPEIERLARDHEVQVMVGGLRPGPAAEVLDDRLAAFLRRHWVEIAERTGQPFDIGFLDRQDGWLYDTEPAAIAVTVMRDLASHYTLPYFSAIQRAFYAEGRDVTDFDVLTAVGVEFQIDEDEFRSHLDDSDAKRSAWRDFSTARSWGISGFPTVVARLTENRLALVARGWTPAAEIDKRLMRIAEAV